MKKLSTLFTFIFLLIFTSSCSYKVEDLALSEIKAKEKNDSIIIFVHGITGNHKDTWTNPENGAYWPDLFNSDPDLNKYDISVINYYSELFNNKFTLRELGVWLNVELSNFGILGNDKYKNIIFIAHSMGNLVIRSAIFSENKKYEDKRILLLVSLASPSRGSTLASIGNMIFPDNTQLSNLSSNGNHYIYVLNKKWNSNKGDTKITCAYEKLDFGFIGEVVDRESSTAICGNSIVPFYANHSSISKPKNAEDRIYIWVKNEILSLAKEGYLTKDNFLNMYSVKHKTLNEQERDLEQLKIAVKKLSYGDIDEFMINNIPLISGGIACEEFNEMYQRVLYSDVIPVIRACSKHIKKPLNPVCLEKLINHALYSDRPEVSSLLLNN